MFKLLLSFLVLSAPAKASPGCPVCLVGAGAFLGVSRWLGISDNASGVFIGAMMLMLYFLTIKLLVKKNWTFRFYKPVIGILTLSMVPAVYTLVLYKNTMYFGIDGFLLSMIAGAITFIIGEIIYQYMKAKNNGKAHFPFEHIVIKLIMLFIVAAIFNNI